MTHKILDNGVERDATPEEVAEIEGRKTSANSPEALNAKHNAEIDAQIVALEAQITPRMTREALIGSLEIDSRTGRTAAQQIAYFDAEIAVLRAQRN